LVHASINDRVQRYVNARPYLYHLTNRSNLSHICETAILEPAAILMVRAGRADLLRMRRRGHVQLETLGILLRDQAALHLGNLRLVDGYTFEDFIESLNRRIFFWPGTSAGPISYGKRHFKRYDKERPVILRIGFQSLVRANPAAEPHYCAYNSGSPRCSNGERSPRGPKTFLSAVEFTGTPSQVVEVTFDSSVKLPPDTQFRSHPEGPWDTLL
jgi:hypothetical protein